MKRKSNGGFTTVWLVMILSCLMILLLVVTEAASGFAAASIGENLCLVAARSVLSEYSVELFDHYGIFALRSGDTRLSEIGSYYIGCGLDDGSGLVRMSLADCIVSGEEYPALSYELLMDQIRPLGAAMGIQSIVSAESLSGLISGLTGTSELAGSMEDTQLSELEELAEGVTDKREGLGQNLAEAAEDVSQTLVDAVEDAARLGEDVVDAAGEASEMLIDAADEVAELAEDAAEFAGEAGETATKLAEDAAEFAGEAGETAAELAEDAAAQLAEERAAELAAQKEKSEELLQSYDQAMNPDLEGSEGGSLSDALKSELPSEVLGVNSTFSLLLSGGIGDISTDAVCAGEYILTMCSNLLEAHGSSFSSAAGSKTASSGSGSTVLNGEAEYILYGHDSDKANEAAVKLSIFEIRSAVNLVDIYKDPALVAQINAEAAAFTPVPQPLAAFAIASVLAAGRAVEDVTTLFSGGKVPFTENGSGGSYEDYLRVLLALLPQKEKLVRLMDVMQMNLTEKDGASFAFRDYCYGVRVDADFEKNMHVLGINGFEKRQGKVSISTKYQ